MRTILAVLALGLAAGAETPHRTLSGHENVVLSVAFSPDGGRLASGSSDNSLRLWDLAGGRELKKLGNGYAMSAVCFSPDGRRLGTGSWGGQLWDLPEGRLAEELETQAGFITAAGFSADGAWFVTGSLDGSATFWNARTGHEGRSLNHGEQINCLAFSRDGRWIATGGDTMVRLWDPKTGQEARTLRPPATASLAFSPDSRLLAAACEDQTVRVWVAETGAEAAALKGHGNRVLAVAFSPNGKTLASAGADKVVRLWSTASWRPGETLAGHGEAVYCLAFSPDGRTLASGSADKTIRLWDIPERGQASAEAQPSSP